MKTILFKLWTEPLVCLAAVEAAALYFGGTVAGAVVGVVALAIGRALVTPEAKLR